MPSAALTLLPAALALLAPATAAPVEGGVQAAVFPEGLAFVQRQFTGFTYEYDENDIGAEVGCYDRIGVRDLELVVPVRSVDLELRDGTLAFTVRFDPIYAEDLRVYGQDEDYLDACVEFDADVAYVQLDDAVLQLAVSATVRDGALALDVVGTPTLSGDLDTDIEWFPDDIALYYFEELLLDTIAESIGDLLPDLVAGFVGAVLYGDQFGEFAIEVGLDRADLTRDAVELRASPTIAWLGTDGCPQDRDPGQAGANPTLAFDAGRGSSAAIGITEGTVNELFLAAWRDGYFCFTQGNIEEFLGLIAGAFDPSVGSLTGTASLGAPPRVTIDADGLHFRLDDIGATVSGELDGERADLLTIRGDVSGALELGLDQGLSAFTLSVRSLTLDVVELEAAHLAAGAAGEAELQRFVEEWVGGWVSAQAQDLVLFSSLYWLWDIAVRVDAIEYTAGGLAVYVSLFGADDPEVDTTPPDTAFELADAGTDFVELRLMGRDDRDGPLAYSVQLDGAGWSAWSTDTTFRLDGLPPGVTHIEVAARDAWLNVDPSPAEQWLEVGTDLREGSACGCGGGGGATALLAGLAGAAAARRRRRS